MTEHLKPRRHKDTKDSTLCGFIFNHEGTKALRSFFRKKHWCLGVLVVSFCLPLSAHAAEQRIVSLGSSVTQQLYMLGVGKRIVGNTSYCSTPEAAKTTTKVGTIREANVEKILSLRPDIVFATGMSSLKQVRLMEKLGLKVIPIMTPKTFDEICENFKKLGELTGSEKQAETIIDQAKAAISTMTTRRLPEERPRLFFQIGVKPIFTVSKSYYLNDLIKMAGAMNIAETDLDGIYSRERVIADDPDIIVITTMGVHGEKEREIWQQFPAMTAVKNKAIHIVDSEAMCNPNPMSFVENLRTMIAIVNPEIE